MNEIAPSLNGTLVPAEGRGGGGRFVKGWRGGPGNPMAKRVNDLRMALLAAVTPEDLREVIHALLGKAKRGDVAAIKELLDRCIGRPLEPGDILEQIAELKAYAESVEHGTLPARVPVSLAAARALPSVAAAPAPPPPTTTPKSELPY